MTIAMRLAAVLILLWISPLAAQPYPAKPIRVVVPFAAGGIADLYARIIGARVTDAWGQPVVIENRTGAGGNIGADAVAKFAARRLHARDERVRTARGERKPLRQDAL
jgi:tripartite-type tricarboxylate transporter receptor subunit TctC